ncbi:MULTISPECIES: adenosylcobinamide-GDP ribazoletransferase [Deefgea]|uniref:Adenosylcobinamide-GDP ribazoletransferase n=1 Tax=Deefgea chitinilytica TaxID=570276 RepID=A0ABS2CGE6_9NEIS|nr:MULTISPECIES: adenosylcobinamide-GDP ribazoletransferase [Deefgea]MBM5572466.1 adenosylcobinamide-GDP ribazoletransferase [Deefgea chitinilytica]MBM9889702.1 adenosylcobinamide-GDP ribazoletransferase [Deefgea sp. CFH1-16]
MKRFFDWREPILAIQFLTRIPTPQIHDFEPSLLAKSVGWFPAVGLVISALLLGIVYACALLDPWLAAILGLAFWTWITGGLHLDGLADMSDGLGAAHRDPARFLAVLKDPHLGSFGVLSLIIQCLIKLVLLMLIVKQQQWAALLLIPAWARSGVFIWQTLPALAPGMAEQFAWKNSRNAALCWWSTLLTASAYLSPVLLIAPLVLVAYRQWLKAKIGGVTGDCLGAGIEISESGLLLIAVVGTGIIAAIHS